MNFNIIFAHSELYLLAILYICMYKVNQVFFGLFIRFDVLGRLFHMLRHIIQNLNRFGVPPVVEFRTESQFE